MSDSDSDLAFESADEDAEFAFSFKEKSKINLKSVPNDEPLESLASEKDASSVSNKFGISNAKSGTNTDGNVNLSSNQQFSSVLKETVDDFEKLQCNYESKEGKSDEADTDYCTSVEQGSNNTGTSTNESELKSDKIFNRLKPISEQKVNTPIPTDTPHSPKQVNKSVPKSNQQTEEAKTHKERVVLRLEKKQLPKESTENENTSDFVNILHDPSDKQASSWGYSSWDSSVQKETGVDFENLQSNYESKEGKSDEADTDYCTSMEQGSNDACTSTNESKLKSDKSSDSPKPISEQKVNTLIPADTPHSPKQVNKSVPKSNQQIEETKTHRERVVLRLEKKKQLPKESPTENEKPSDFVNILHDPSEKKQASSWGFSSWGSSLLSSAASSVSTFSSHVSQGIGTVFETVESTLGAPPPEELAQTLNEKKAEIKKDVNIEEEKATEGRSGLLSDVSSWTKVLENSSSKVIMGGLDALELIGKKTMDILTEGDPGLRKKRAAFTGGANLSELLKEIKARADEQIKESCVDDAENVHYSQIFDEKQGLVHLEALEMLSKQSQAKFQRLLMRHSKHTEVKKRLEEIKSICENIPSLDDPSDCENFEDFEAVFKKYTLELSFPLNVENIIKTQRQISEIIYNYENTSEDSHSPPKEIFQSAICSLADFTAKCIETFHKAAELILVQPNLDPDLENCATNLTGLTTVMCIEVNNLSARYHKCLEATAVCLQKKGNSENTDVNILATNVYVEASNSNNYIQDAYQMLVPVLQVRFLEAID